MKARAVFLTLALAAILTDCGGGGGASNGALPTRVSAAARSADPAITNLSEPVDISQFVPCAASGAGETVTLTGNLHVLMTVIVNANSIHVDEHFQPQGVSGIGSVTGNTYRGTGVTRQAYNAVNATFPYTYTLVNNFRIIGPGPDNNFLLHENAHYTINANGVVTAARDNFSELCR